ncbi:MAG: hypothetical protein H6604_02690 [Flavobacteriales bacterium]|nr:hypothetical protein [Flavobacteriales bacterium]
MKLLSVLLVLFTSVLFSQTGKYNTKDYPEGIYESFEEFLFKKSKPINDSLVIKYGNDSISHRFYYKSTEKRLKNVFAISYKGELYITLKMIYKRLTKDSKGQLRDDGNYFVKVNNVAGYLYLRDYFTSSAASIFGGITGTLAARRQKIVLFIEKEKRFKIIKNLKLFEEFIKEEYPNYSKLIEQKEDEEEADTVLRILKDIEKQ